MLVSKPKLMSATTRKSSRTGFTLIELLVVIVILGLLIGLLVPAVMNAINTAKDAATAAEIRAMSQALADFKSKFGVYPPSRILISENGDYSAATVGSAAMQPLATRTLSYFRRIWPRMQFNTGATAGAAPGITKDNWYDVNGNGNIDGLTYTLTGPECLVLFLGGVPQPASGGANWATTGFSKNPTNPFQNFIQTTNRTVPYYEFNNSRLVSNPMNPSTNAYGGFPGFRDNLGEPTEANVPTFYSYFSAYEGTGYDPDDVNFDEPSSDGKIRPILGVFTATNVATPSPYTGGGKIVMSAAPNPYTNDVPVSTGTGGDVNANGVTHPWQNAQTFQIIAPGRDRLFGIGGQYIANGNDKLPFISPKPGYAMNSLQTALANFTVTGQDLGPDTRTREKDNVTNFSAGKLD